VLTRPRPHAGTVHGGIRARMFDNNNPSSFPRRDASQATTTRHNHSTATAGTASNGANSRKSSYNSHARETAVQCDLIGGPLPRGGGKGQRSASVAPSDSPPQQQKSSACVLL